MTSPSSGTSSVSGPARSTYLGGSDAPSILGVSPWRSAFRCWAEKVGAEEPPDLSLVSWIHWGVVLEAVVAEEFQRRTGLKVRTERRILRHPKYRFIGGHIDRRVPAEKTFLECKTSNAWDYRDWGHEEAGRDGVPLHYQAQCEHYMNILNCQHCYLAVLIGGNDFRVFRIERSPKMSAELLAAELEFWRRVEQDDPPPLRTEADARIRWKKAEEGTAKEVLVPMVDKLVELGKLTESISALEDREQALRDEVFVEFEDREALTFNGDTVARLTCYSQQRLDSKALKAKHPKLHDKFSKTSLVKRLKVLV